MINQEIIQTLKSKLSEWSPERIREYDDSADNNILIGSTKDTVLEWTDTGYYQIYPQSSSTLNLGDGDLGQDQRKISFTDCNIGHTYSLAQRFNITDWYKYQQLYLSGVNNKIFRIDVPLEQQIVDVDGIDFEYTRIMRPGSKYGDYLKKSQSPEEFLNLAIDEYYNLIKEVINVADDRDNVLNITIRHRLTDENGAFYTNLDNLWEHSLEKVIQHSISLGNLIVNTTGKLQKNFCVNWTDRATQKWLSLIGK